MQLELEKTKPKGTTAPDTPEPVVQKVQNFTARMHFYAVHHAGEQLRHSNHNRTRVGKKPDRMVGR